MQTALFIFALILIVTGLLGAVLPGLPGPPLAWAGMLLMSLRHGSDIGTVLLVVSAAVCIIITVLDYLLPGRLTKRFGGGKAGIWGCNIGLVLSLIGLPFGPQGMLGLVFWPFVGALVGEWATCKHFSPALKAAFGAFAGFLGGTLLKVVYCLAAFIIVVADLL